ncbi:MAG: OmpA family protein [Rhodobacteraceae bacterium]|nr:OmpA family protein [Paracoccaceae bacterium]
MFRVILCVMTMCLPGWVSAQAIGTVNFDFDVDQLDAEAKAKVAEIAAQLDAIDSYKPTVVIGHTDAVGTSGYNFDLGLRRARNVAAALTTAGVTVDRIGDVESRGKTQLLVNVTGPERVNRRVTVSLGEILDACRSYRAVEIKASAGGSAELQQDLRDRLTEAVTTYAQLAATGANGPAFQMAGATQDDCSQAVGFDGGSLRKVEYAKRCFCSSARMRTALGR